MVSVHFSGGKIRVVCGVMRSGKLLVTKARERLLPKECERSGRLTDISEAAAQLKALFSEESLPKSGVRIVLDIGAVKQKQLELPRLSNEAHLRSLAREKFSDFDGILDFVTLSETPNSGMGVLACMAEKHVINDYIEAARLAGLRLKSIEPTTSLLIRLSGFSEMLEGISYGICAADGFGVSVFVFSGGKYVGGGRYGISEQRGSKEFLDNAAVSLNVALNLNGTGVSDVLLAGFDKDEREYLMEQLKIIQLRGAEFPNLTEILLPEGVALSEYLCAVSALL